MDQRSDPSSDRTNRSTRSSPSATQSTSIQIAEIQKYAGPLSLALGRSIQVNTILKLLNKKSMPFRSVPADIRQKLLKMLQQTVVLVKVDQEMYCIFTTNEIININVDKSVCDNILKQIQTSIDTLKKSLLL